MTTVVKPVYFLLVTLVLAQACSSPAEEPRTHSPAWTPQSFADSVAAAHGFAEWAEVERFDFRFAVSVDDTIRTARDWQWYPATDSVIRIVEGESTSFLRSSVDSVTMKADAQFINDTYWVLMPFYLVWSKDGYSTKLSRNVTAPLSAVPVSRLTIQYGDKGGYTPGDAYDLYIDDSYKLLEWTFRKGGQAAPSMIMDWSDYRTIEGLVLPTEHLGDGPVRIFHPHVAVMRK